MPGRLENKIALVTGGGRGIGRAIAEAFAHEGADLAIAEIDAYTGQDAARAIESAGRRSLYVSCDVAKKPDIDRMVACVIEYVGRIDILVNNAGIHVSQPFLEVSEELYDHTLNTNLKSQFFCAQAVALHMVARRGGGKIINISSVSAEIADLGASHYCVGKGGTQMLTRAAALELAPHNIQVNAISPGTIKTDLPWYDTEECLEYCKTFVPAGRFAQPQEVTGAAIFLASEESNYVTGSSVTIDGGLTVQ